MTLIFAGAYDLHMVGGRFSRLLRKTPVAAVVMAGVWVAGTFYLRINDLFSYSRAVFSVFLVTASPGLIADCLLVVQLVNPYRKKYGRRRPPL